MSSYGTMAGSSYTLTFDAEQGTERPRTPSGLLVTRAIQTKDGWRGQILVDKEIVYESNPTQCGDDAITFANTRVVDTIKGLFTAADTNEAGTDD